MMKFPYVPNNDRRDKKWNYELEAKEMLNFINDGDVVYDIGANIADHTVYFALNKDIKIFGFEPIPEYFKLAQKNIEHFQVKNIELLNIGISDKKGKMGMAKNNESNSFLGSQNKDLNKFVEVSTIDDLISEGVLPPNVIKIDIEGWAEFAFRGGVKSLEKYKPIIMLETHSVFLTLKELESKFKVLEDIGYKVTETLFNKNREFILQVKPGKTFKDFESIFKKQILNSKIFEIRDEYDSTSSKEKLKSLKSEYKILLSQGKVSLIQRLIWSKLYRLFTGKWLKTK